MTSNSIRSFAFGILIAAGVCGLVYFTAPNEANSNKESETKKVVETASPEEMKKSLEDQGYIIHTSEEWNNIVSNSPEKEEDVQPTLADEKVIYRTMISVSSGMTSIDIGDILEQTEMVDDSFAFSKEVENRGLSSRLKPGIYEVNSEMSVDELIAAIFK
jgi:cell division protein YceG involved in septum cleavage